jgi:hypothetical protein
MEGDLRYHDQYSRVLMSKEFWKASVCDRILIMQSDTVLCSNSEVRLSEFFDYEYVGGYTPKMRKGARRHMNGGLSFRNRFGMLRCVQGRSSNASHASHPISEDVFFSGCEDLKQPSVAMMNRFSIDNAHEIMEQKHVPFGVHKPWSKAFRGNHPVSNMMYCDGAKELRQNMIQD